MTQFVNISPECNNIVRNFFKAMMKKSVFGEADKQLMVSLYKRMPNAESKVLEVLGEYIVPLEEYMSEEDINTLLSEYAAVVGVCYKYSDPDSGSMLHSEPGFIHLPSSLVELCMKMAEPKPGSSVFLPFAGEGAFLSCCPDCTVDGFEMYPKAWALFQIVASSINCSANIILGNENDGECLLAEKKYNYIFTFPPMFSGSEGRSIIDTVYQLITKHLEEDGEFYAILPSNFCTASSGWFDVRKILLDKGKDFSALVLALPPMLQPISSLSLCLVHFAKNHKGVVALADVTGEEFFARHDVAGNKEFVLKVNSVLESINKQDEKYVWVGHSNQLTGDVNLLPSRYLVNQFLPKTKNGETLVPLSDLIEIVPFYNNEELRSLIRKRNEWAHGENDGGDTDEKESAFNKVKKLETEGTPLIGMRELSSTYLNCVLNRTDVPLVQKIQYQELITDCFLVGFMSGKFKVAKLKGTSKYSPVYLRSEVTPFLVKSKSVSEDFLLRSLMSEDTERQAKMLSSGITISRLSKQELLSIKIVVPSLEQQEILCKEDTRTSLTESDRKIIESYEEFRKDMHMKKHAIGQTIFNLNNWWKVLQKARKDGNGIIDDNAMVGKSQPISVSEIYDNIQEVINKLQQQINRFDRGNGLEVKNIALTEFIEDYISSPQNQSPLFKYIYDKDKHHSTQMLREFVDIDDKTGVALESGDIVMNVGDPFEYAEFAPDALKIIFDNIVSNATSHGFENRDNVANIIKVELSSEGDDFVVTISNNGNPLNANISSQDVFTYNKSSKNGKEHFGLGGYEVQKLMREFNGDAVLVSEPESDFPVSYKLIFHNTNFHTIEI